MHERQVVGMKELEGRCRCGAIELSFATELSPADIEPRLCDCSFCVKHAAAYVSDSGGRLVVRARTDGVLGRYRRGTETAEFLVCMSCGALVGVVAEIKNRLVGAVNARCAKH